MGWKCVCKLNILHWLCPKWLLTQHLKNVHDIMVKKAKLNCASTCERGPSLRPHLDQFTNFKPCSKMTKRWLFELAQRSMWSGITFNHLQKGNLRCISPFWCSYFLLIFANLGHSILGCWEYPMQCPHMHWKWWDLQTFIHIIQCVYVKRLKIVRDGIYWEWE